VAGPRRVSSAHLQLQVANVTNAQSVTGGVLHAITGCSWDERTVTWSTQPAIDGPVLAVLGAVAQGQTVDFDVTPAISGDGVYCFALDTISTDSALYSSREATVGTPQVAVNAVCPWGPAPTTTTTSTTTTTEPPPTTTTTVSHTSTTTTGPASTWSGTAPGTRGPSPGRRSPPSTGRCWRSSAWWCRGRPWNSTSLPPSTATASIASRSTPPRPTARTTARARARRAVRRCRCRWHRRAMAVLESRKAWRT